MKFSDIKKPGIKLPKKGDFKMPEFSKRNAKKSKEKNDAVQLSEGTMIKLWTAASAVCIVCSGIALVVSVF